MYLQKYFVYVSKVLMEKRNANWQDGGSSEGHCIPSVLLLAPNIYQHFQNSLTLTVFEFSWVLKFWIQF